MRLLLPTIFGVSVASALSVAAVGCVDQDSNPAAPIAIPELGSIDASVGKLELAEANVDFGYVDCGSTSPSKSARVKNAGSKAVAYTLKLEGSGFVIEGPTEGTIAPGAEATITVKATVEAAAEARVVREGAVLVSSTEGLSVRVPLKVIPEGATLTVTPSAAAFGQVNVGDIAPPIPVTIKNVGFVPVQVSLQVPSAEFGLAWTKVPDAVPLGPRAEETLNATFAPTSLGAKKFSAALTVVGPVCGALPKALEMSGEGVIQPVMVTPSILDFGSVDCGTAAPAKTVTLTNDTALAFDFTAALTASGASAPFTVSPASGKVAANTKVNLTITPKPLTAPRVLTNNAYGDTLTITTTSPGDAPHVVDIIQSARGAILGASLAPNGAFGTHTTQTTTNRTLTLTNSGNQAATVRLATTAPFAVNPASPTGIVVAANGGTGNATVSFTPVTSATSNASVSFAVTGAQCSAAPPAIALSGTGALPVYGAKGSFLPFNVTCGTAPAGGQTISIDNGAGATGQLLIGNIKVTGPFTVSPTTLPAIDPGKSATLTVSAKAAVVGTDSATQVDTGTLTFTTNEVGSPTKTFSLQRNVHGANLEYADLVGGVFVALPQLNYSGCPSQTPVPASFYVRNTGDQDVATVNAATLTEFTFATSTGLKTFGVIAGAAVQMSSSYTGPVTSSRAPINATPVSSPSSNVCRQAPVLPLKYNLLTFSDPQCVIIL